MSSFQRLLTTPMWHLGQMKVSCLWKCPDRGPPSLSSPLIGSERRSPFLSVPTSVCRRTYILYQYVRHYVISESFQTLYCGPSQTAAWLPTNQRLRLPLEGTKVISDCVRVSEVCFFCSVGDRGGIVAATDV